MNWYHLRICHEFELLFAPFGTCQMDVEKVFCWNRSCRLNLFVCPFWFWFMLMLSPCLRHEILHTLSRKLSHDPQWLKMMNEVSTTSSPPGNLPTRVQFLEYFEILVHARLGNVSRCRMAEKNPKHGFLSSSTVYSVSLSDHLKLA